MSIKIIFGIFLVSLFTTEVLGQNNLDEKYFLSQIYAVEGSVTAKHQTDAIGVGYKSSSIQLFAPFYTSDSQVFALETNLQNQSILNDQRLDVDLALGWQLTFQQDWNLIAGVGFTFSQLNINKESDETDFADELAYFNQFSDNGAMVEIGVMQKYFWALIDYRQGFTLENQFEAYTLKSTDATLGGRFLHENWEFRLPIQINDLENFNSKNVYFGAYIGFKNNYFCLNTNSQGNFSFELGLKPYSWLRIGVIYDKNTFTSTPSYGMFGSYHWKSQKLNL